MGVAEAGEPGGPGGASSAVAAIVDARPRQLDAITVGRVLPSVALRHVGPFVFFDHIGPAELAPGAAIDVRPHPHINLATVTYLFEGEIMHRDSLGSAQVIRPGAINWMTAGRGIVHSERTPEGLRQAGSRLHGLQLWVALPVAHEEVEPDFCHYPAEALPSVTVGGVRLRVLAGAAYGVASPVRTLSPLFYVEAVMPAGSSLEVLPGEERAAYVVEGAVACGGERAGPGRMLIFAPGSAPVLSAEAAAHVVLIGGAALDGPRHLWWNFVSSSPERIERAKRDWQGRRFAIVPGDEDEFIPLPEGA